MTQPPFPGPGHDGGQPVPGDPARDWAEREDRYLAWLTGEIDAGREEARRVRMYAWCLFLSLVRGAPREPHVADSQADG